MAAAFVLFTAALGVFLAIPMKRQMINHEQLRFPSGIATAETLAQPVLEKRRVLEAGVFTAHRAGRRARSVGLLHTYAELVEQLKLKNRLPHWLEKLSGWLYLPDTWDFTGWLNPLARGQMAGLAFEPSVLLVGAGMITGLRVSLSMFAGSALLYYVVAPHLLALDAANAGVAGVDALLQNKSRGQFQPHALGAVGRHVGDGVLQPGAGGVELADGAARVLDLQKGGTRRRPRRRWTPSKCRTPGWSSASSPSPRADHRAILRVSHRRVAGAAVRGVFLRGLAGGLPRDGRDGHHADWRDGQDHAAALRRAARRERHCLHQPDGRRHHGGGGAARRRTC